MEFEWLREMIEFCVKNSVAVVAFVVLVTPLSSLALCLCLLPSKSSSDICLVWVQFPQVAPTPQAAGAAALKPGEAGTSAPASMGPPVGSTPAPSGEEKAQSKTPSPEPSQTIGDAQVSSLCWPWWALMVEEEEWGPAVRFVAAVQDGGQKFFLVFFSETGNSGVLVYFK